MRTCADRKVYLCPEERGLWAENTTYTTVPRYRQVSPPVRGEFSVNCRKAQCLRNRLGNLFQRCKAFADDLLLFFNAQSMAFLFCGIDFHQGKACGRAMGSQNDAHFSFGKVGHSRAEGLQDVFGTRLVALTLFGSVAKPFETLADGHQGSYRMQVSSSDSRISETRCSKNSLMSASG